MIPVIVTLTVISESVLSVPVIVWPVKNVPSTLVSPNTNSVISVPPITNLNTSSTTAVASLTEVSTGSFSCVIVWPIKCAACESPTSTTRIIFLVSHLPSDTLKILSLGYLISAFSLNSNLKNISLALFVPFAW